MTRISHAAGWGTLKKSENRRRRMRPSAPRDPEMTRALKFPVVRGLVVVAVGVVVHKSGTTSGSPTPERAQPPRR